MLIVCSGGSLKFFRSVRDSTGSQFDKNYTEFRFSMIGLSLPPSISSANLNQSRVVCINLWPLRVVLAKPFARFIEMITSVTETTAILKPIP